MNKGNYHHGYLFSYLILLHLYFFVLFFLYLNCLVSHKILQNNPFHFLQEFWWFLDPNFFVLNWKSTTFANKTPLNTDKLPALQLKGLGHASISFWLATQMLRCDDSICSRLFWLKYIIWFDVYEYFIFRPNNKVSLRT